MLEYPPKKKIKCKLIQLTTIGNHDFDCCAATDKITVSLELVLCCKRGKFEPAESVK